MPNEERYKPRIANQYNRGCVPCYMSKHAKGHLRVYKSVQENTEGALKGLQTLASSQPSTTTTTTVLSIYNGFCPVPGPQNRKSKTGQSTPTKN